MERALHTAIVDHFASDTQVGSHVRTVAVQGIHFARRVPKDHYIVPRHLNRLGFMVLKLMTFACNEPSVGIRR